MNDNYEVFLSYSSDVDPHIFDEIVRYFEPSIYHFSRDSNEFGESLKHSLSEKISRCRLILVMITPGALKSAWVRFEIESAQAHKKTIVAIAPNDLMDDELPIALRDQLAVKYTTVVGLRPSLKTIREKYLGYTAYIPGGGFGGGMVEFCAEVPKALFHIGDRPMLFHVIDSLEASPFREAVVVNQEHHAPDFISYVTKLEYSKERALARGTDAGFSGNVTCASTRRERWPQALKDLAPKDTFLVNMCDIILSFDENARTKNVQDLQWDWKEAVDRHKHMRQAWGQPFLGTLITCNYYRLAAGIISERKPGASGEIRKVKENPETPVPLIMNTGVAILEPGILEYIEETDESLLEGAITRVLDENHERRFVEYRWPHWSHVMHVIDLRLLHKKRLAILQNSDSC